MGHFLPLKIVQCQHIPACSILPHLGHFLYESFCILVSPVLKTCRFIYCMGTHISSPLLNPIRESVMAALLRHRSDWCKGVPRNDLAKVIECLTPTTNDGKNHTTISYRHHRCNNRYYHSRGTSLSHQRSPRRLSRRAWPIKANTVTVAMRGYIQLTSSLYQSRRRITLQSLAVAVS